MKTILSDLEKFCKHNGVEKRVENIEKCLDLFSSETDQKRIKIRNIFFRTVCYHTGDLEYWWDRQKNVKTFSNSLFNLISFFGEEEGVRRFEENKETSSKRNKGHSTKSRWVDKGYSNDEITILQKEMSSKRTETRLKNNNGIYNSKSALPWCKEYYLGWGLSDEEVEELRKESMVGLFKLSYSDKQAMFKKRTKTRMNSDNPLSGGVSKESVKFFEGLVKKYPKLENSLFGKRRERWLRDPEHFDRYYFYDLTNLDIGLIIEYDGWEWHPRTRSGEWNSLMKVHQSRIFHNDR